MSFKRHAFIRWGHKNICLYISFKKLFSVLPFTIRFFIQGGPVLCVREGEDLMVTFVAIWTSTCSSPSEAAPSLDFRNISHLTPGFAPASRLVATSSLPLMALPLFVLSEWWSALGVPFLSYLSRSSQSSLSGYPRPSPWLEATAVCWAYHVHVFPLLSLLPLGLLMAHCFPPLKPPLRCCLPGEAFPDHTM